MNRLDVCNLALMYIGVTRPVQSFSENSTEAQLCNRVYDTAKEIVLKAFAWEFSKITAALTVTTETSNKFEYVYEYPDDCIRILSISDSSGIGVDQQPFEVSSIVTDSLPYKRILTNVKSAYAEYILNVYEEALPGEFLDALAWKVATMIGTGLSKTPQTIQFANQMYEISLSKAQKASMYEKPQTIINRPSYLASRGGWLHGKF